MCPRNSPKWKIVVPIILVILTAGCSKDVEVKSIYTVNKVLFISASIETYRMNRGRYPISLKRIEPILKSYESSHRGFLRKYLSTPWRESKLGLFKDGWGDTIRYFTENRRQGYYLYSNGKSIPLAKLKKLAKEKSQVRVVLVHNGNLVGGPNRKVSDITLENMTQAMRPIFFQGHTYTF
jgi:hypothetical protein